MKINVSDLVRELIQARALTKVETIQTLWSGYGDISRYQVSGGAVSSVVVKHVRLPEKVVHPRGWNTNLSHQRKIRSYQVECNWYQGYSEQCDEHCRVPRCLGVAQSEDEFLIVMEDLDASGFSARKETATLQDMQACLTWLAHFHARFMRQSPESLWEVGTYWHLDTRPDELGALNDAALKAAAHSIDHILQACPYQTIIHGDAKLANFCFAKNGQGVAAVDFQYVGGGCGMKDVAYFIGSCLDEAECERYEQVLLDSYFSDLTYALKKNDINVEPLKVEQSWRSLYAVAWTDFHRFLKGWSPGHWKIHGYSERLARQVVSSLDQTQAST